MQLTKQMDLFNGLLCRRNETERYCHRLQNLRDFDEEPSFSSERVPCAAQSGLRPPCCSALTTAIYIIKVVSQYLAEKTARVKMNRCVSIHYPFFSSRKQSLQLHFSSRNRFRDQLSSNVSFPESTFSGARLRTSTQRRSFGGQGHGLRTCHWPQIWRRWSRPLRNRIGRSISD